MERLAATSDSPSEGERKGARSCFTARQEAETIYSIKIVTRVCASNDELTHYHVEVVPLQLLDADLDEDLEREAAGHLGRGVAGAATAADNLPHDARYLRLTIGVKLKIIEKIAWIRL